jgi:hypothetical protein
MTVAIGIVLVLLPLAFVLAVLGLAAWRDRRREEIVARQIMVTDAIHRHVGAVVAPTVEPRFFGPWRLRIAVPFQRPDVVVTIVEIAHHAMRAFSGRIALASSKPMEIVLTPQEDARMLDEYTASVIVEDRLREFRAEAERLALLETIPPTPVRARFGFALMRFGRWLAAPTHAEPSLT